MFYNQITDIACQLCLQKLLQTWSLFPTLSLPLEAKPPPTGFYYPDIVHYQHSCQNIFLCTNRIRVTFFLTVFLWFPITCKKKNPKVYETYTMRLWLLLCPDFLPQIFSNYLPTHMGLLAIHFFLLGLLYLGIPPLGRLSVSSFTICSKIVSPGSLPLISLPNIAVPSPSPWSPYTALLLS